MHRIRCITLDQDIPGWKKAGCMAGQYFPMADGVLFVTNYSSDIS